MRITGHQPNFLPNLAFFLKMNQVDLFVISTNLRFERKDGWMRRNKIETSQGEVWLTVPVFGSQAQLIKDVKIDNSRDWSLKHVHILEATYRKTKGSQYLDKIKMIYGEKWESLVDLNMAFINLFKEILGIKTKVIVDEGVTGVKQTIFINVCKKYGADTFVSGIGAKHYLTKENLKEIESNNISHLFVEKDLTPYKYSLVHYLLKEGKEYVVNLIN